MSDDPNLQPPTPMLDDDGLPLGYDLDDDLEVTPRHLREHREDYQLIDCREVWEHAMTKIGDEKHVPLGNVGQASEELAEDESAIVVYCRSGKRSLEFAKKAREAGVKNIKSLAGGINAWNAMTGGGPQY